MLPMLLAGAGLGGLQAIMGAKKNEQQKNMRAAETMFSPWSGIKPSTEVEGTNALGDIAGGALSGASFAQNLETSDLTNQLLKNKVKQGGTASIGLSPQPFSFKSSAWGDL